MTEWKAERPEEREGSRGHGDVRGQAGRVIATEKRRCGRPPAKEREYIFQ
jgi:hypothetical protein